MAARHASTTGWAWVVATGVPAIAIATWVGCSSASSGNGGGPGADGGGADARGDGPAPSQNLCVNASDMAARAKLYCPGSLSLDQVAAQCGVTYAFTADAGDLETQCIVAATDGAVSSGCASCYTVMIECAKANCITDCVMDPLGNACLDCRCGDNPPKNVNCYALTEQCSGVPRQECAQLDAGTWDGYPSGDAGCPVEAGDDGGSG